MISIRRCSWVLFLTGGALLSSAQNNTNGDDSPQAQASSAAAKPIVAPSEQMIVTGSFWPVPLSEVDRSVTVIEVRDDSLLYTHWIDYLVAEPSVDLQQRAPNDVQADLSIRGSSLGQTSVLINGLRVDDVQTSHHDMDLPIPPDSLQRIEVLRGPGSTLYGSDAMGGAVNFITRPPAHSEIRIGAGIGNFGTNQQSGSFSIVTNRLAEQLSGARDFSTGFAPDRDYRSFTLYSDTEVKSGLGTTALMLGYGDKPFGADQFYGNFNSWERTKTWFAGWAQELGQQTELDLGYRRHTDVFILLRDQPQVYENNHVDESWQVALRRRQALGHSVNLFYGGEGDYDSIHSNNLGDHSRSRGAAYAGSSVRTTNRLLLSIGGREEIFDSGDYQFAPVAAAGFWLTGGWKLKGSVSRAYRLPTYTDLYYHDPANVGNPNLSAESAWGYEVGVDWNSGGKLQLDATAFGARQKDVIDYVQYFPGDLFHAANIHKLNFVGIETSLRVEAAKNQQITISYTGLHGVQEALHGLVSRYAFNYPGNNADLTWLGHAPWQILMRTRVGVTQRIGRDPYAVWDLSAARQFGRTAARLSLTNLTDSQYQEIPGVVMPGRAVLVGLEYTLRSTH